MKQQTHHSIIHQIPKKFQIHNETDIRRSVSRYSRSRVFDRVSMKRFVFFLFFLSIELFLNQTNSFNRNDTEISNNLCRNVYY